MARNQRDVVPGDGNWRVVKPGSKKASATAPTQKEAIDRARELLKNDGGGEIVIHRPDGTIRDSDTVAPAKDPNPPKDTK